MPTDRKAVKVHYTVPGRPELRVLQVQLRTPSTRSLQTIRPPKPCPDYWLWFLLIHIHLHEFLVYSQNMTRGNSHGGSHSVSSKNRNDDALIYRVTQ